MSISFLLFTVEQRLKSLPLYSLQKMALKVGIKEGIIEKHISTLRVMLLYRYFLGMLPVIWKRLSADVMRSIIPFLITDIYITRRGRVFLKNMIKTLEFRKFLIIEDDLKINFHIKKIKRALTFDDKSLDLFVISEKQKIFDKKEFMIYQNNYRIEMNQIQMNDPDEIDWFILDREQATLKKKAINKKSLYKIWKGKVKEVKE